MHLSCPFYVHKMRMLALLGPFTDQMTHFRTLSYTATNEIPIPFLIPEAWERYPVQAEPPRIGNYRSTPPPPPDWSQAVAVALERPFYPIYSPVSSQFIVFRFFRFFCRAARRTVLAITLKRRWMEINWNGCFLLLRKTLLDRFCVGVWVLCGVFSIFCITSFGNCTRPRVDYE